MENQDCYGTTTAKPLSDGAWHHVAATQSVAGHGGKLYIDGVLVRSSTAGAVTLKCKQQVIGYNLRDAYYSKQGNPFQGSLDNVGLWSRALSAAEISTSMDIVNAGLGNLAVGLAVYYRLSDCE